MFAESLTTYKSIAISDTFLGSILGQIGIVGFLIWISYFSRYFLDILFSRFKPGSMIIVSQILIAALSENTLNFTSFLVPGIISVLANNKFYNESY